VVRDTGQGRNARIAYDPDQLGMGLLTVEADLQLADRGVEAAC
jgi:hypothetical protein